MMVLSVVVIEGCNCLFKKSVYCHLPCLCLILLVNFDEFVKILQRPGGFAPAGTYEEFVDGFQVFDKKRTGYISVTELKYG